MKTLITVLVAFVALEHIYFLILEMFLWTAPKGIKTFGLESKAFAEKTKVLAANQGLYNGFLAAGLLFGLFTKNMDMVLFLIICIIIAGIYGAYSTKKIRLFLCAVCSGDNYTVIFNLKLTFGTFKILFPFFRFAPWKNILKNLRKLLIEFAPRVLTALVILIVGLFIISLIIKTAKKGYEKTRC